MKNCDKSMDTVVALAKARGFVYAGSEIYGGLSNSWDYGPLSSRIMLNALGGKSSFRRTSIM